MLGIIFVLLCVPEKKKKKKKIGHILLYSDQNIKILKYQSCYWSENSDISQSLVCSYVSTKTEFCGHLKSEGGV